MTEADLLDRAGTKTASLPATTEVKEIVTQGPLLSAIVTLAKDPAVDVVKLQALMEMQERMEARQAERAFTAAFASLSARLPRVRKNGTISLVSKDGTDKGSIPFARWEDMDKIIRPLLVAEGFALSFDSAPRQGDGGGLVVTATLMHKEGHSRTASMALALDAGPGRNNLQAMGSSLSYGKRYTTEMLLNIVREGDDDDGVKAETIDEAQKAELVELLRETNTTDTGAFLKYVFPRAKPPIQSLDEIPATRFPDAKAALEKKKARQGAKK